MIQPSEEAAVLQLQGAVCCSPTASPALWADTISIANWYCKEARATAGGASVWTLRIIDLCAFSMSLVFYGYHSAAAITETDIACHESTCSFSALKVGKRTSIAMIHRIHSLCTLFRLQVWIHSLYLENMIHCLVFVTQVCKLRKYIQLYTES